MYTSVAPKSCLYVFSILAKKLRIPADTFFFQRISYFHYFLFICWLEQQYVFVLYVQCSLKDDACDVVFFCKDIFAML